MSKELKEQIKRIALTYPNRYDNAPMNDLCASRIGAMIESLKCRGLEATCIPRDDLPPLLDDFDLVIAAGGDGTQLDASMRIRGPNTSLCAVRLFPERSVGFLCCMDYGEFDRFAEALANKGTLKTDFLPRFMCIIDDSPVSVPFLNDILIAHECPARASRYRITFGDETQLQCSSGIWIATNSGSHAAAHAAGADPLPPGDLNSCIFVVRELSQSPQSCEPLRKAKFCPDSDVLTIESVSSNLHLYFDGALFECPIKKYQSIRFRSYPVPLCRVFC